METSFLDLRYKTREVLKALTRREKVYVTYRHKLVGTIIPAEQTNSLKVQDHKFFGTSADSAKVTEQMDKLRENRYDF